MDGYAVNADDTHEALPSRPKLLKVGEQTKYLDTGDPIPESFNTVIAIEDVEIIDPNGEITKERSHEGYIRVRASTVPWKNVRNMGEDITETQLLLVGGHKIRSVDLGVIASAGFSKIEVTKKPKVAIIPTGSELIPIGTTPKLGDIIEFNSIIMAGMVNEMGGAATRYSIIRDEFDEILNSIVQASKDHDLILLNAGSSAGSEDFSSRIIQKIGELIFHGVAIRPGHPVIFGMIPSGSHWIPIIGVPGFPVSATMTMDLFVKPMIEEWIGIKEKGEKTLRVKITKKITASGGDLEYLRVAISKIDNEYFAAPLTRKSGSIFSFAQADGVLKIPSGTQGYEGGEFVNVDLIRDLSEIENTIFCVGSHDLILDELTQYLSGKQRRFLSVNVGSQAGLIALSRGESHLAGSHLLDPETGEYNIKYIKKYCRNIPVKVIALAHRDQGFFVLKDNPKNIRNIFDLIRKDVNFVNRQRGSGTRVLFDYHLNQDSISPNQINGYLLEEYTHFAVASAVASGRADCGLGIAAAALIYNLEFVPLFKERYDLVIPQKHADSILIMPLFDILNEANFKNAVSSMKGYDLEFMGKVIWES